MKKIILTCFEPFGGRTSNVSTETISKIKDYKSYYLPVGWDLIKERIDEIFNNENPDILILTGEAASYPNMKIELEAHNIANGKDNYNVTKEFNKIIDNESDTLKTSLDVSKIDIEKSVDAGKYLCNCSYFYALHKSKTKKVLFVHFPINQDNDKLVAKMYELINYLK